MVKSLLENIDGLKKKFAELQPLSFENSQKLDKKFRLEWNFNSNHIEGNTLTYGETELLLIFDQTKGNHELREYEEMKGHDVALKLIYDLAADKERSLTEKFIRELNEILLVRPFYKEAITADGQPTRRLIKIGEYKSFPNSVRLANEEIFHYPSPAETPALMSDLMNWYHEVSDDTNIHPIEVAAQLHYKFVCIHPFDDGNGRISRLLMNYHLIKNDYPPVIIKSADKKNYLFALREADTGNLEVFNDYIAEQLLWSYEVSIKAGRGESIDEEGDWEKKIKLLNTRLEKNKQINKTVKEVSLKEIFDDLLIPLSNSLINSEFQLNNLFIENTILLKVPGIEFNAARTESQILNIFDHAVKFYTKNNLATKYISLVYELLHFKKNGANSFSIKSNIEIVLDDYKAIVTLKGDNPLEKDIKLFEKIYTEKFDGNDNIILYNVITSVLLTKIEEAIKS